MQAIFQALDHGWVGALLAVVGIGVPFYIYHLSNMGPCLVYQARALRLIGQNELLPPQVQILFESRVVDRLTKTYLVIWNAGKSLIRGSDIVASDELRCEFPDDGEILEVHILKSTKAINNFTIEANHDRPNIARIGFDYLDPGDGAVVQLLHTATVRFPKMTGAIMGMPHGIEDRGIIGRLRAPPFPFNIVARVIKNKAQATLIFNISLLLIAMAAFFLAIFPGILADKSRSSNVATRVTWLVLGVMYIGLFAFVMWVRRRRFPKALDLSELFD
jgi:hypothetical protein